MLKVLSLLFVLVAAQSALGQSRIITTSGAIYLGTIISEDHERISFMTEDSVNVQIPRNRVESVSYGRVSGQVEPSLVLSTAGERSVISASHDLEEHWALGLALGTPAIFQPTLAFYDANFAGRASIMYWGEGGLQISALYGLYQTRNVRLHAG